MKSIEILIKEHHLIHRFLDLLLQSKANLEKGNHPNIDFLKSAVVFSKSYTDQFHHFKEEFLMFGLLAQKKEGTLDGQIGALRYQHERCRQCMMEIEKSIQSHKQMDEMIVTHILEHLSGYTALLFRHIYLEDHVFFPIVCKSLSSEDDDYLITQFLNQERNMEHPDFNNFMTTLVDQMAAIVIEND